MKLSKLLEETLEDRLSRLKQEFGEVKPEDIKKAEEDITPRIEILGTGKENGLNYIEIFFINEQGKRYKETFYSNPFQIEKFKAKMENIESFLGQMKAYQNFKKIADDFKSEELGRVSG